LKTATGTLFYSHDPLGSVTDITNPAGTDQAQYAYTAYGTANTAPTSVSAVAAANPFGYTGQLNDPVLLGTQDLRLRTYNSAAGVFTSRDPLKSLSPQPAVSPYAYVDDEPTTLTDPSGACWWVPFSGDDSCTSVGTIAKVTNPVLAINGWLTKKVIGDCVSGFQFGMQNYDGPSAGAQGCVGQFDGVNQITNGVHTGNTKEIQNGVTQLGLTVATPFLPGVGTADDISGQFVKLPAATASVDTPALSSKLLGGLSKLFLPDCSGISGLQKLLRGLTASNTGDPFALEITHASPAAGDYAGRPFELRLISELGGVDGFSIGGRQFDGAFAQDGQIVWYEAKSGEAWNNMLNTVKAMEKFKGNTGQQAQIAASNGRRFQIFSDTPIPDKIASWLDSKGISYMVR
jgi:RHS repeat-associated protein